MLSKVAVFALLAAVSAQTNVQVPASGSAFFESPNYPNKYDNNVNVVFNIQGGVAGSGFQFDSVAFDLERGNYDTLTFTEVVGGARVTVGTFSGNGGPNKLRSSTNSVTVTFKTDSSETFTGFRVGVSTPVCRLGTNLCKGSDSVCIAGRQHCDGQVDCPGGVDEANCPEPGSCGKQAIKPDVGRFRNIIASMVEKKNDKIIGGTEVTPHSWPWQVAFLTSSNQQICGGSLIGTEWVLTAAHCCEAYGTNPSASTYKVLVGAHDLASNSEETAKIHTLSRIVVHPLWNTNAIDHDYCLLKLSEPVQLSAHVQPVCLGDESHGEPGKKCWVTGWGVSNGRSFDEFIAQVKAQESGLIPKSKAVQFAADGLRQVDLDVTTPAACNAAWGSINPITPSMICATNPGKSSCNGDSGGPFVCDHDGQYQLVGAVSWGIRGCTTPGYPAVFARVSLVRDWIAEVQNA